TAYVTNEGSNNVSVINTTTNTVTATITVGTNPFAVAVSPDGTTAYVTNEGSNNVSVINTTTNTVTATITVGTNPNGVAVSPGGTTAYITNFSSNDVSVINTTTDTVTTSVTVGTGPIGVVTARVPAVATASCPTGHVITGGGYQQSGGAVPPGEVTSRPVGNTWQVLVDNKSTNYTTVTPYAVCAP
ncbi:YncE family protein, partial [Kitasatospora sp. NPDC001175]|uniref:YncE family protein n=1 Tax=Kitasatospora sp. NPDC001175 TaxID=3157103 RepID=UPI003CFD4A50